MPPPRTEISPNLITPAVLPYLHKRRAECAQRCQQEEHREKITQHMLKMAYADLIWENPEEIARGKKIYKELVKLLASTKNTAITKNYVFRYDPKGRFIAIQKRNQKSPIEYFLAADGKGHCSNFQASRSERILIQEHTRLITACSTALIELRAQPVKKEVQVEVSGQSPIDVTEEFARLAAQQTARPQEA